MKYYVVQSPNGRWSVSTSMIWGEHKFRTTVNATNHRQAIAKAKAKQKES